jgi:uncharacterized protein YbcI
MSNDQPPDPHGPPSVPAGPGDRPSAARGRRVERGDHQRAGGIQNRYLGRGPKTASTFHYGNVLVTLMHDVLAHAEKSLTDKGQIAAVDHIRHLFQETMEADFREAVERLTGRKVLAFISGNHIDPDIAAELFILDGPPGKPDPDA